MSDYRISGTILASDLPLPELPRSPGRRPDWRVRCGPLTAAVATPVRDWRLADGELWMSCSRRRDGYLLCFPGLARVLIASDHTILVERSARTPASTLRHLLLDQVFPLALTLDGCLVLHAAAVLTSAGAIGFLGAAGLGKSTLAASFGRAGYTILSDDCLVVRAGSGAATVWPSYPGLRLWPEAVHGLALDGALAAVAHYSEKQRVSVGRPAVGPARLRRLYVLVAKAPTGFPIVETLTGRDAVMTMLAHSYRLNVDDGAASVIQLEQLTTVAAPGIVRRLVFPRGFDRLAEVRSAILDDLAHAGP